MNRATRHLSKHCHHFGWSRDHAPSLVIAPGTSVAVEIVDTGGGEITPSTTLADMASVRHERFTPLTGPIYVEGAAPGDALKITFLGFRASGWGWSHISSEYGILADQFPDEFLKIWQYDPSCRIPVDYNGIASIPLRPFPGIIGLAHDKPGVMSALPPYATGGNLDVRDLNVGTELYLPVEVPGGLLSMGDTHVAQGHGELAGTALESPVDFEIRVDLVKDARLKGPCLSIPAERRPLVRDEGAYATCGVAEELAQAAREATSQMIDLLGKLHGISPIDAYLLCSLCGDLIINQMVNRPVSVVGLYFPKSVLLQ